MIHTFCRAIGFSALKKNKDLYRVLEEVINHPDDQVISEDADGNEFACFSKNMGENFGISVCGNFITEEEFRMEYYYPYLIGSDISTYEQVELEQQSSKLAYAGICDELNLGVTLIFYVTNVSDVLYEKKMGAKSPNPSNTVLSALSTGGMILLPIARDAAQKRRKEQSTQRRKALMEEARKGNTQAMETLTMRDMDIYSSLPKRVKNEDILTIVESSFIPYGVESDQYMIVGEISNCYKVQNTLSNEWVWILNVVCNNIRFDVCVNAADLYGEPEIGRRFKGRIWLQGHLNFGY